VASQVWKFRTLIYAISVTIALLGTISVSWDGQRERSQTAFQGELNSFQTLQTEWAQVVQPFFSTPAADGVTPTADQLAELRAKTSKLRLSLSSVEAPTGEIGYALESFSQALAGVSGAVNLLEDTPESYGTLLDSIVEADRKADAFDAASTHFLNDLTNSFFGVL